MFAGLYIMFKALKILLFIDQSKNQLSHTKFWSNVGYAVMSWGFWHTIYYNQNNIEPILWLAFGAIIIGNRTARKIIENKEVK